MSTPWQFATAVWKIQFSGGFGLWQRSGQPVLGYGFREPEAGRPDALLINNGNGGSTKYMVSCFVGDRDVDPPVSPCASG
jgi:hypothetical protein